MPDKCPICKKETTPERAIKGGRKVTDYVCEYCNIVWYIDTDKNMRIGISATHSRASKMNDDDFKKLLKRIADYEKG